MRGGGPGFSGRRVGLDESRPHHVSRDEELEAAKSAREASSSARPIDLDEGDYYPGKYTKEPTPEDLAKEQAEANKAFKEAMDRGDASVYFGLSNDRSKGNHELYKDAAGKAESADWRPREYPVRRVDYVQELIENSEEVHDIDARRHKGRRVAMPEEFDFGDGVRYRVIDSGKDKDSWDKEDKRKIRPMGGGGFAEVYELEVVMDNDIAYEEGQDRTLVAKVMMVHKEGDKNFKNQDHRRIAYNDIESLNLVGGLSGVRQYLTPEGDLLYIMVIEKGGGQTAGSALREVGKKRGKYAQSTATGKAALSMFRQLDRAHDLDILHRDIKPANLMVSEDAPEKALLIDWGLAKNVHTEDQTGFVVGSPPFMTSEALRGDQEDTKARDVYGASLTALIACGWARLAATENFMEIRRRSRRGELVVLPNFNNELGRKFLEDLSKPELRLLSFLQEGVRAYDTERERIKYWEEHNILDTKSRIPELEEIVHDMELVEQAEYILGHAEYAQRLRAVLIMKDEAELRKALVEAPYGVGVPLVDEQSKMPYLRNTAKDVADRIESELADIEEHVKELEALRKGEDMPALQSAMDKIARAHSAPVTEGRERLVQEQSLAFEVLMDDWIELVGRLEDSVENVDEVTEKGWILIEVIRPVLSGGTAGDLLMELNHVIRELETELDIAEVEAGEKGAEDAKVA